MFRIVPRRVPAITALVLMVAVAGGVPTAARAQDEALEKSTREFVGKLAEELSQRLAEVVQDDGALTEFSRRFADLAAKVYGPRIVELEKKVAAQDAELAALRAKVAELSGDAPTADAATDAPEAAPTGAFLGVSHVDHDRGALVTIVHEASPAAKAGVKVDDIIVSIGDAEVSSPTLSALVGKFAVGADVLLGVVRGDQSLALQTKLVDREEFFAQLEAKRRAAAEEPRPLVLGIEVEETDGQLVVDVVDEGLTGAVIGLEKGDVIVEFGGRPVPTTDAIVAEVRKVSAGDTFQLLVRRGDRLLALEAVGSDSKSGAKLVSSRDVTPADEPKPAAEGDATDASKPAYLGVAVVEEGAGLLVESVVEGAAAAVYGVQVGDYIVSVKGQETKNLDALVQVVRGLHKGDRVDIVLRRGSEDVRLTGVLLGAKGETVEKSEPAATSDAAEAPAEREGEPGFLGVNAYEDAEGGAVVVKDVIPDGPAAKAGVASGDVILRVQGAETATFDALETALHALRAGDEIVLVVRRGDEEKEIRVKLSERPGR